MSYTSKEELEEFFQGAVQHQWLAYMERIYGAAWRFQWLRLEENDDPVWTPKINDYYLVENDISSYRRWEIDDQPIIDSEFIYYTLNEHGEWQSHFKEIGEDLYVPYGWAHADQRWTTDLSLDRVTVLDKPGDYEALAHSLPTADMKNTMFYIARAMADYYWEVVNEIDITLMPLYIFDVPFPRNSFKISSINPKKESDVIPVIHPNLLEIGKPLSEVNYGAWREEGTWLSQDIGVRLENGTPHEENMSRFRALELIIDSFQGIGPRSAVGRVGIWYDERDPNGFVKNPRHGVAKIEKAFHTFNEVFVDESNPSFDGTFVLNNGQSTHNVTRAPVDKLYSGELIEQQANFGEFKEIFANFSYIETFYVSEVVSRRNGRARGVISDKFAEFDVPLPTYMYAYVDEYNTSRARFITDKGELFLEFDDELPLEEGHQFSLMSGGEHISEEKQLKKVIFSEIIADLEYSSNLILAVGKNLYKIHEIGQNYVIVETEDDIELKKAAIFDYKAFSVTGELSTPVGKELSIRLNATNLYLNGVLGEFDNLDAAGSVEVYGYGRRSTPEQYVWLEGILYSNLAVLQHFIETVLEGEMKFHDDFGTLVDFDQVWGINADNYLDLNV